MKDSEGNLQIAKSNPGSFIPKNAWKAMNEVKEEFVTGSVIHWVRIVLYYIARQWYEWASYHLGHGILWCYNIEVHAWAVTLYTDKWQYRIGQLMYAV